MSISKLYKVGDSVVFYSPTLSENRTSIYEAIKSGTVECLDTSGTVMSSDDALYDFVIMADYMQNPKTAIEQIYRNISLFPNIVSVVRSELLDVEDGYLVFAELAEIISVIQTGGFGTAEVMLRSMTESDYLTREMLDRWADMLHSASAIVG